MSNLPLRRAELHDSERPSSTAQWTTIGRALELCRPYPQHIVTDFYAPVFLSAPSRAVLAPLRLAGPVVRSAEHLALAGVAVSALCRHRFIDDHLLRAVADGIEQVVILGAGYDTRAYRFASEIGDRSVFEVDLAPLSRRKARIVAADRALFGHASINRVEIDFRTQSLAEQLIDASFEQGAPTFVAWEGVSMYLTPVAMHETLAALGHLCGSGSTVAMDFWQHAGTGALGRLRRIGARSVRLIGEPLDFVVPAAAIDDVFAEHGFEVSDRAGADVMTERYATAGRRCDPGMHVAAARRR